MIKCTKNKVLSGYISQSQGKLEEKGIRRIKASFHCIYLRRIYNILS